ncbi:hypothetical protein Hanom_Chr08g00688551 [Helianthus anomalus]
MLIKGTKSLTIVVNNKTSTKDCAEAARTQASTTTNYDVGSTTWADLRRAPLQSAMEVTNLGHGPF